MQIKYNPFTNNLDLVGGGGGGSGILTINSIGPDGGGNFTISAGSNITITPEANGIQISSTAVGFTWNGVPGTTQLMVAGNGYVCTNAALTTLTLPLTATPLVDLVKIVGYGAGGIQIAQQANAQIFLSNGTTTTGPSGFVLSSPGEYCYIMLLCVALVGGVYQWVQVESGEGNFTTN